MTFQQYPRDIRLSEQAPSETYYKYPPFHTFEGRRVLNLGCGRNVFKTENVVNLDAFSGDGVNVVCDLSEGKLPFADESFDFIIANHVMEHIPNWFETMKEMARVLKVGGRIEIWVPPISSDSSFGYRDHINRIGLPSFFGCRTFRRAGTNLYAADEIRSLGAFRNLEITNLYRRTIINLWTTVLPEWLLARLSRHLRNFVSEEGYFFKRLPSEDTAS